MLFFRLHQLGPHWHLPMHSSSKQNSSAQLHLLEGAIRQLPSASKLYHAIQVHHNHVHYCYCSVRMLHWRCFCSAARGPQSKLWRLGSCLRFLRLKTWQMPPSCLPKALASASLRKALHTGSGRYVSAAPCQIWPINIAQQRRTWLSLCQHVMPLKVRRQCSRIGNHVSVRDNISSWTRGTRSRPCRIVVLRFGGWDYICPIFSRVTGFWFRGCFDAHPEPC